MKKTELKKGCLNIDVDKDEYKDVFALNIKRLIVDVRAAPTLAPGFIKSTLPLTPI